ELARARLVGDLPLTQLASLYPDYPFDENPTILSAEDWQAPPRVELPTVESRGGTATEQDPAEPREGRRRALASVAQSLAALPSLVADGDGGMGSNSWVVSGEHTESGLPLLANDPHMAISQPGVWLQAGLHCRTVGPECPFDVSG